MRPWLITCLALIACSDSPPGPDASRDGGLDGDAEGDGSTEPFEFDLVVESRCGGYAWERGAPLPGAFVAVDDASGRREHVSDERGRVAVSVDPAAPFTVTVARPLYRPVVTLYELTPDDVETRRRAQGDVVVTLCSVEEEAAFVPVIAYAFGVPPGARWYTARYGSSYEFAIACWDEPGECGFVDGWFQALTNEDMFGERPAGEQWVTALLVEPGRDEDAPEAIVAFDAVTIEDTTEDQYAPFYLYPDDPEGQEPTTIADVTIRWPEGSQMERRGPTLHPMIVAPYSVTPAGASSPWGGALRRRETATSLTVDVVYFPRDGVDLSWEVALVVDSSSPFDPYPSASRRFLSRAPEPGETYEVLDIPATDDDDLLTLSSDFTWSPIDGAELYRLDLVRLATTTMDEVVRPGRSERLDADVIWSVQSHRATSITLPELPSSYSPDWWMLASASVTVHAFRNLFVEDRAPDAGPFVDYDHSVAVEGTVTLEW